MSSDIPQEFSPTAPKAIPTESRGKTINDIKVSGSYLRYETIARDRYQKAIAIAEKIDDTIQTSIPFNKNAVHAASLLMLAAVRGAQIS